MRKFLGAAPLLLLFDVLIAGIAERFLVHSFLVFIILIMLQKRDLRSAILQCLPLIAFQGVEDAITLGRPGVSLLYLLPCMLIAYYLPSILLASPALLGAALTALALVLRALLVTKGVLGQNYALLSTFFEILATIIMLLVSLKFSMIWGVLGNRSSSSSR